MNPRTQTFNPTKYMDALTSYVPRLDERIRKGEYLLIRNTCRIIKERFPHVEEWAIGAAVIVWAEGKLLDQY